MGELEDYGLVTCTWCEDQVSFTEHYKCVSCTKDAFLFSTNKLDENNVPPSAEGIDAVLCQTCVAPHVKRKHDVTDCRGHVPGFCPQHNCLLLMYCNSCTCAYCNMCTGKHYRHAVEAIADRARKIKTEVFQIMTKNEENLKPVAALKSKTEEFTEINSIVYEKYKKVFEKEKMLEELWSCVEEVFQENCEPVEKANEQINFKLDAIYQSINTSDDMSKDLRSLLLNADSCLPDEFEKREKFFKAALAKQSQLIEDNSCPIAFSFIEIDPRKRREKIVEALRKCFPRPSPPVQEKLVEYNLCFKEFFEAYAKLDFTDCYLGNIYGAYSVSENKRVMKVAHLTSRSGPFGWIIDKELDFTPIYPYILFCGHKVFAIKVDHLFDLVTSKMLPFGRISSEIHVLELDGCPSRSGDWGFVVWDEKRKFIKTTKQPLVATAEPGMLTTKSQSFFRANATGSGPAKAPGYSGWTVDCHEYPKCFTLMSFSRNNSSRCYDTNHSKFARPTNDLYLGGFAHSNGDLRLFKIQDDTVQEIMIPFYTHFLSRIDKIIFIDMNMVAVFDFSLGKMLVIALKFSELSSAPFMYGAIPLDTKDVAFYPNHRDNLYIILNSGELVYSPFNIRERASNFQ